MKQEISRRLLIEKLHSRGSSDINHFNSKFQVGATNLPLFLVRRRRTEFSFPTGGKSLARTVSPFFSSDRLSEHNWQRNRSGMGQGTHTHRAERVKLGRSQHEWFLFYAPAYRLERARNHFLSGTNECTPE